MTSRSPAEDFKAKGNEFFKAGRFSEALELYNKAIELDVDNGLLYSNRSAAFVKLNQYRRGLEDAKRCIELKPQWPKGFLRKITALEGLGQQQNEIMATCAAGFKVTGDGKMKREFVERWLKANQDIEWIPQGSIELPRGILVLSEEYRNVLYHLLLSLDGVQPLSQETVQQCLYCCTTEIEKLLNDFGEPVSEDVKEWVKHLSGDIFPYPSLGLANRKEVEEIISTKTVALIRFMGNSIDPAIYPILRPVFGLIVLVVLNRTNILSNTNTGHQTAEFMNRFLLPLFEKSLLQTDDYYSMYIGRLCAILDSFIGRGYHLTQVEISLVKECYQKLESALRTYPKQLVEYAKDKLVAEQALHNVKHNILLPSAAAPPPPLEGSPMSVEVARVVVKERPDEVKKFLSVRLKALESIEYFTMNEVEELVTMSGIFLDVNDSEKAMSTFTKGEQSYFTVLGHLLKTNAIRLDELSATIIPARQLVLSTASLFAMEHPDIFADVLIRWKSLFSEIRMLLIRLGLGSVLHDFFRWYTEMKMQPSGQKVRSSNEVLVEFMDKEKDHMNRYAFPALKGLSQQNFTSVQKCLTEGEAVLEYIFFSTFKENPLLDAYCVFFESTGLPIVCKIDYKAVRNLAAVLSDYLTTEQTDEEMKLMRARIGQEMTCLSQVLFPGHISEILCSGRITHLYVSPDRDIAHLPLASLPLHLHIESKSSSAPMLCERIAVSILSSSRVFLRQKVIEELGTTDSKCVEKGVSTSRDCCIFANPNFDLQKPACLFPTIGGLIEAFCDIFNISDNKKLAHKLPNSQEEAEFISQCLKLSDLKVKMFCGDDANLSNALSLSNPLMLHVSSHAFSSTKKSTYRGNFFADLNSNIILAGYNTYIREQFGLLVPEAGMGVLPALAVYSMKLDGTRLVFLSTCVSAAGTSHAQESVANLVESFLAAGAETVIATHWSIEDESATKFCKYFYDMLKNPGVRPSEALNFAKRAMNLDLFSLLWSTSGAFECYGLDKPLVD